MNVIEADELELTLSEAAVQLRESELPISFKSRATGGEQDGVGSDACNGS